MHTKLISLHIKLLYNNNDNFLPQPLSYLNVRPGIRTYDKTTPRHIVGWAIIREPGYAPNVSYAKLALALLMLRVLTDNSDSALTLDDFALIANRFY